MQKNKIYKDFNKYFINQWSEYFNNKSLCLKDINKNKGLIIVQKILTEFLKLKWEIKGKYN